MVLPDYSGNWYSMVSVQVINLVIPVTVGEDLSKKAGQI